MQEDIKSIQTRQDLLAQHQTDQEESIKVLFTREASISEQLESQDHKLDVIIRMMADRDQGSQPTDSTQSTKIRRTARTEGFSSYQPTDHPPGFGGGDDP